MTERHTINMDGTMHGPTEGDCIIPEPDHELEDGMDCGHACPCGGVIHWQPVYGGYYFQCDGCDESGISSIEVKDKARLKLAPTL